MLTVVQTFMLPPILSILQPLNLMTVMTQWV
ncbi:hypothetical protein Pint_16785 [Pistacia integerrima]|uniref:Uncharacterized protein n=1 Tax=Pistacia integerrima TaxID=434235 RepID=A0ACC0Z9F9_9ROSI|nr:hypothetical protein Pint_16785 [Pistacia integerrima]